jgi:hypothetical protein
MTVERGCFDQLFELFLKHRHGGLINSAPTLLLYEVSFQMTTFQLDNDIAKFLAV